MKKSRSLATCAKLLDFIILQHKNGCVQRRANGKKCQPCLYETIDWVCSIESTNVPLDAT